MSDRKLGSGACGSVFMAIKQSRRTQLACKIVDLRRLKVAPRAQIRKFETTAAAEDVDSQRQLAQIKLWAEGKQAENHLEEQLKVYHREASILAALSHVSKTMHMTYMMPRLYSLQPNIIGIEKVYITDNSM